MAGVFFVTNCCACGHTRTVWHLPPTTIRPHPVFANAVICDYV